MPAEIQTARALSIVSALIWFIMMIVGVMGLECTVYKKGSMHKVLIMTCRRIQVHRIRNNWSKVWFTRFYLKSLTDLTKKADDLFRLENLSPNQA